jgi:ubiquinone/menaquinone biosynthesis C-methylase UbiE
LIFSGQTFVSTKNTRKHKYSFILTDATGLPFRDNSFKVITAIDVIERLSNYSELVGEGVYLRS